MEEDGGQPVVPKSWKGRIQADEMDSILSMFNIPISLVEQPNVDKPYWIVDLPSEEYVKKIASRSVLLKNVVELWSRASSESQLHENLKKSIVNPSDQWVTDSREISDKHVCPKRLIDACSPINKSYKVVVETFCKHFSMKEKVDKIEEAKNMASDLHNKNIAEGLSCPPNHRRCHDSQLVVGHPPKYQRLLCSPKFFYLPFQGPVKLKNPDVTLTYIEFYGQDPNNVPDVPCDLFFGRLIAEGQRDVIQQHSLKTRSFIGNTSMDPTLALLAATQAQVNVGDIVLDPFVGSGSLLVAATHWGAYTWGSDIDFMMLHARTRPTRVGQKVRAREESIRSNMRQYGTEARYLDVVVSDSARPMWKDELRLDAVITDPPYGVRESTEKIGIVKENYTLSPEQLSNHIPAKVEYSLPHIYRDLLEFSAKHLEVGRRLVCWYPVVRKDYTEEQMPSHPRLRLVANSEQTLSRLTARRLLTFEKLANDEPDGPSGGTVHNFREKYFNMGEMTRRERKEKRAQELTRYLNAKSLRGPT